MATAAERMTASHKPASIARLWAKVRGDHRDVAGRAFRQMDREKAHQMKRDELPLTYEL